MHFKPFEAESVSQNFVSDLTIWKISWPNPYKKRCKNVSGSKIQKNRKKCTGRIVENLQQQNFLKGKLKKKHGLKWLQML